MCVNHPVYDSWTIFHRKSTLNSTLTPSTYPNQYIASKYINSAFHITMTPSKRSVSNASWTKNVQENHNKSNITPLLISGDNYMSWTTDK